MEDPRPREFIDEPEVDYECGTDFESELPCMQDVIQRLEDVTILNAKERDVINDSDDSYTDSLGRRDSKSSSTAASTSDGFTLKPFMADTESHTQSRSMLKQTVSDENKRKKHVTIESKRDSLDSRSSSDSFKDLRKYSSDLNGKPNSSGHSVKGLLKRLTSKSRDKTDDQSNDKEPENVPNTLPDKLPQVFIVKYMGKRECLGLWGIKHVRTPVDEMVQAVTEKLNEKVTSIELPLVYALVSHKGMDLRVHKNNKIAITSMTHFPIDFISYGVQDVKFPRVFTFIVVQEMSSRSKKMECHAFVCDTPHSARLLALSLASAFRVYMKLLESQGKQHRFQVELRPPDDSMKDEVEC